MLERFHPAVRHWFEESLGSPTEPQTRAWPAIQERRHTLIAAPTGSGKTLAAFLAAINDLVESSRAATLPDETRVLYLSPLKALSHDIEKNLKEPLAGIDNELVSRGEAPHGIRVGLRTGDTPAKDRARTAKRPPQILVTTPESFFILLTSASGRRLLATVRTVIVDEIHAIMGSKRGSHLALGLERLVSLVGAEVQRIALSATQRPIEDVARFLVGPSRGNPERPDCAIIDLGHARRMDLQLERPNSPLEPVMANDVWAELYDRFAALAGAHRTTLVFVAQRRLSERVARALGDRMGDALVAAHHGSMSREMRLDAEERLKAGTLRLMVATSSLELGIDIGTVDLVIQVGSPRAISAFLQRVGRSGHVLRGLPKGRLVPVSRDDLVECLALLDAVRRGELDTLVPPEAPLDVLAQHLIGEAAGADGAVDVDTFLTLARRSWPYRSLDIGRYEELVGCLADGWGLRRGRRGAPVFVDATHRTLHPRPGARLLATSSGGAIPDQQAYDVVLEPEAETIGNVHEDFAIEAMPGNVFQLGNANWKILRVEPGVVRVTAAHGAVADLPFWIAEGPARTDALSASVGRLFRQVDAWLRERGNGDTRLSELASQLAQEIGVDEGATREVVDYLAASRAALSTLPDGDTLIAERFFDEAGNTHLVLHTRLGARINRAWGLALRKAFCRSFDFELQAAANDDAIVLSLGPTHSFPLEEVFGFLRSTSLERVLVQAVLDSPIFGARWRWATTIALAVPRARRGKKVLPARQRIDAEDLLSLVFPQAKACFENIPGDREVPEHPLVEQALHDCLHEGMDVDGLMRVLTRLETGRIRTVARDLPAPSPLAAEILNGRPYTFLDEAPLEERRTNAIAARRWAEPTSPDDIGMLDADAIAEVCAQAWPSPRTCDELHDALNLVGYMTESEALPHRGSLAELVLAGRASEFVSGPKLRLWVSAERLAELQNVHPGGAATIAAPRPIGRRKDSADPREDALRELVRSRLEVVGPVTVRACADSLGVSTGEINGALAALEAEGFAMRGHFSPTREARPERDAASGSLEGPSNEGSLEWCNRGLLARIQRITLGRLRKAVEPVTTADYIRFLFAWQQIAKTQRNGRASGLRAVLEQLEGFDAPALAWESEILPSRVPDFDPRMLDALCRDGSFCWIRGSAPTASGERVSAANGSTRIVLVARENLPLWRSARPPDPPTLPPLSERAHRVLMLLSHRACFLHELERSLGLRPELVQSALTELVARGEITADSWSGLRELTNAESPPRAARRNTSPTGRWSKLPAPTEESCERSLHERNIEQIARILLRRWGVLVRRVVAREGLAPAWRDLLRALRRLEARGEVHGGRFVAGQTGEQFALPDAVEMLRRVRKTQGDGEPRALSAADPLNLIGILTPGARVPAIAAHRIVWCDGIALAVRDAHGLRPLDSVSADAPEAA